MLCHDVDFARWIEVTEGGINVDEAHRDGSCLMLDAELLLERLRFEVGSRDLGRGQKIIWLRQEVPDVVRQ